MALDHNGMAGGKSGTESDNREPVGHPHWATVTVYCMSRPQMKPAQRRAELLGGGIARIDCLECGGTGWWAFMEPEIAGADCVDCKGTGKRFIACWVDIAAL